MKTDLKKQIATYSAPRGRFEFVTVAPQQFLMVDGHGDPNTAPAFAEAVASLFPLAYRMKFGAKADLDRDYGVMPLEALWWSDDMDVFTGARDKARWSWTVMNLVPDWITVDRFEAARAAVAAKGTPGAPAVRLERYDEGGCVRPCTSAPTTTKARYCTPCTTTSSPVRVFG